MRSSLRVSLESKLLTEDSKLEIFNAYASWVKKGRKKKDSPIAMLKAKYSYTVEYLPSASTTMW